MKVPEKEEPIVDQTKEITPLQEVEDTNNTEQTTKPNSQTSPSKVAASQIAEKPLTDNEKIEIIKEEYSDEEINARISDNEEMMIQISLQRHQAMQVQILLKQPTQTIN